MERERIYDLQATRTTVRPIIQQIRGGETPDITYLTKMFQDLYDKVGGLCDCPVCLEQMTKEQTAVPLCGHLICKGCKERLAECPTCRKKY